MPPTETSTATATEAPTAEATSEPTPPAEVTVEATIEATAEVTAETTAEAPTVTPTTSETPLPPEPNWILLSSGDFEQGAPPDWMFDSNWRPFFRDGVHAFAPRVQGGPAMLAHAPLFDTAIQVRVRLDNGIFAFGLRQSAAGGYTATFEESGFLRLHRNGQEVAQMFLGPITGQWRTLRLSAAGNIVRVFLDGAELITFVDDEPLPPGRVTLGGRRSIGSGFLMDDLSVWAGEGETVQPAAALAAPMAYAAASESVAGRITSALAYNQYDQTTDQTRLTILTPDGTTSTFSGTALGEGQPWSPDGQRLFVSTPGNDGISLLDLSTGSVTSLTSLPVLGDWTGDSCASWSPNGEWVTFLSTRRDGTWVNEYGYTSPRVALYVMNANGQSVPVRVLLANDGQWLGCPQWLDNDRIVLPKNQYPGLSALVSVNRSGANEHTHFEIEETIYGLAVSQESGKAAITTYTDCGCIFDVRVVNLDDDTLIELSNQAGEEEYSYGANVLNWNPDGTKLLMGRGIPDGREQDLVIADLSQPCPACSLSVLPNGLIGTPMAWSPDGQWIASFRHVEGLFLFTPDGSEVISVLSSEDNSVSALAWQPLLIPEPCMGFPYNNNSVNVRSGPSVGTPDIGDVTMSGRILLARWTNGTTQRWDDWYLVREPSGPHGLGWARADVVYTSPRYGAACGLPVWDQPEAPANELIDLEDLPAALAPPSEPAGAFSDVQAITLTDLRLPALFTAPPAPDTLYKTNVYGMTTFAWWDSWSGQGFYDGTNHIHSGLDFYAIEASSGQDCYQGIDNCYTIRAVCDGVIWSLENSTGEGTGGGLVQRCVAPDGSLSNVYVVYDHLKEPVVAPTGIADPDAYVVAGQALFGNRVTEWGCDEDGCVEPHLHLEVFFALGNLNVHDGLRLNPLTFLSPYIANRIESLKGTMYPLASERGENGEEMRYEWWLYDTDDPSTADATIESDSKPDRDLGIPLEDNTSLFILADRVQNGPATSIWLRTDQGGIQNIEECGNEIEECNIEVHDRLFTNEGQLTTLLNAMLEY